ncbi:MAG: hypothetical protein QW412_00755 [Candidatus Aenigmatarchaeota archaeon]
MEIVLRRVIEMKEKIFILIFILILIPSKAFGFGSLQKSSFAEMTRGETKEFVILFWNLESYSFVTLEPISPEGFVVIIEPKEFLLNSSRIGPPYEDGEYVNLDFGDVKAFPVKVLIKALNSAKGENEIKVKARAETLNSGIKFAQEKTFFFRVKVSDYFSSENKEMKKEIEEIREEKTTSAFYLSGFDLRVLTLTLAITLILFLSFLIYKLL